MFASRRLLLLPLLLAAPALAQSGTTLGYQWLQAVKEEDGSKLNALAAKRSQLNAAVLDYQSDGEGAIHVAVRKNNLPYLRFMLALGANPNLVSERAGETPLTMAAMADQGDAAAVLLSARARVDQGNRSGETPLVKAVRFHRPDMVRDLLARGADPDKADYAGKSARMYAAEDSRNPLVARALADAPKRIARPVAGPKLD